MPTQMPRNGRPERAAWRTGSTRPAAARFSMQVPKAPWPGSTTAGAAAMRSASLVISAGWPSVSNAFCALRRLPTP